MSLLEDLYRLPDVATSYLFEITFTGYDLFNKMGEKDRGLLEAANLLVLSVDIDVFNRALHLRMAETIYFQSLQVINLLTLATKADRKFDVNISSRRTNGDVIYRPSTFSYTEVIGSKLSLCGDKSGMAVHNLDLRYSLFKQGEKI